MSFTIYMNIVKKYVLRKENIVMRITLFEPLYLGFLFGEF